VEGLKPYENSGEFFDCKYCGTNTAHRSHRRNFLEKLRSRLTGKLPFRCNRCRRRFWVTVDARDL